MFIAAISRRLYLAAYGYTEGTVAAASHGSPSPSLGMAAW
jgi:hypothetical protein